MDGAAAPVVRRASNLGQCSVRRVRPHDRQRTDPQQDEEQRHDRSATHTGTPDQKADEQANAGQERIHAGDVHA